MNDIAALRKWHKDATRRLREAKYKAAQAEQFGHPDRAFRWMDQHGAPAARDLDCLNDLFKQMGVSPDGKD